MTIDRFEPVKALDEQRSLVRNRQTRNKRLVVIKGVQSTGFNEQERQAFVELVTTIKQPQCVRVLDAFEDDSRICVVEEYCDGGTLSRFLTKESSQELAEDRILDILAQLVLALRYLHEERQTVHGEISTENVLMKRTRPIIIEPSNDENAAPSSNKEHITPVVKLGSVGLQSPRVSLPPSPISLKSTTLAPELWQESPKFTPATDIWSLGCLLHSLLTRTDFPFGSLVENIGKLADVIANNEPTPISPSNYSDDLSDLCLKMLSKQPELRPTVQQLAENSLLAPKIAILLRPPSPSPSELARQSRREEDAGLISKTNLQVHEAERGPIERPPSNCSSKLQIAANVEEPISDLIATEETIIPSEEHVNSNQEPAVTNEEPKKLVPEVKKPAPKPVIKPVARPPPKKGGPYKAPQPSLGSRGTTQFSRFGRNGKGGGQNGPKLPRYSKGDLNKVIQTGDLTKLKEILKTPGIDLEDPIFAVAALEISREMSNIDSSSLRKEATALATESKTALHVIAESGRVDLAACLIGAGAKIDARTSVSQETPLYKACRGCQLGMVQLLAERGASVDVTVEGSGNDEMTTPLTCAVTCGHVVIVRYLLQVAKASPKTVNKLGQTPLHIAAKYGDIDVARALIDAGADVNARDRENGATPLHRAAAFDRVDVAKLLLQCGADLEARTLQGKTPLHWAAENNNDCIALLLLDNGAVIDANISTPDFHNNREKSFGARATALHLASYMGSKKFMRVLLDRGADIECQDENGCTPLLWASQQGKVDACRLLLERGANVMATSANDNRECTALHIAAGTGSVSLVELLLDQGAVPDARTVMGRTALHWACEMGHTTVARFLISRCPSLLKLRDDESEASPLFDACWFGHEDTVRTLLDSGASANEKAAFGLTPLHAAAEGGDAATVQLLLERGAKINGVDSDKETALHRAINFGKIETVRKLLENGANTSLRSLSGMTAISLAKQKLSEAEKEQSSKRLNVFQEILALLNSNQPSRQSTSQQ